MVTCLCEAGDGRSFFSGSKDGTLAKWEVDSGRGEFGLPSWYACDHRSEIVSIDISRELDLIATVSLDRTIALRYLSTCLFVRILKPANLRPDQAITLVRFSPRGYLIIVLHAYPPSIDDKDSIRVFSVNGELIAATEGAQQINTVVVTETGYQFVAGGSGRTVCLYDLLSLSSYNMLDRILPPLPTQDRSFVGSLPLDSHITALELTKGEKVQQLFVGLKSGELYSLKVAHKK